MLILSNPLPYQYAFLPTALVASSYDIKFQIWYIKSPYNTPEIKNGCHGC